MRPSNPHEEEIPYKQECSSTIRDLHSKVKLQRNYYYQFIMTGFEILEVTDICYKI